MTTGVDGTVEETRVLQRLADLVGDNPASNPDTYLRLFRQLPEEQRLVRDASGLLPEDYMIVNFGTPYARSSDRSIEGPEQQPQEWVFVVEIWSAKNPGPLAGQVRARLLGWSPDDDNCDAIELGGGGRFESRDAQGRPTRWMQSVTAVTSLNNSIVVP